MCTVFTSVFLDGDLHESLPSDYKTGIVITDTPTTNNNVLYFSGVDYKYTSSVKESSTLGKFEQAVKDALPADFKIRSKTWAVPDVSIRVTVTGRGEVKVELSDGAATPIVYTADKNSY